MPKPLSSLLLLSLLLLLSTLLLLLVLSGCSTSATSSSSWSWQQQQPVIPRAHQPQPVHISVMFTSHSSRKRLRQLVGLWTAFFLTKRTEGDDELGIPESTASQTQRQETHKVGMKKA